MDTQNTAYRCLNYVELLAQYEDRLVSMERGFQLDYEFLDLWVPDESHNKSIYYLFESAALRGQKGLALNISPEILSSLDGDGLIESLKALGGVSVQKNPDGSVLTVSFENKNSSAISLDEIPGLATLHRSYRDRLVRETRKMIKSADANQVYNLIMDFQGGKLLVNINKESGLIEDFRYRDMPNHVLTRMLEILCRISEKLPLQELAEHGAIRLENYLRDPALPPVVRGIITPETAGVNFVALNEAARKLFKLAQAELGLQILRNTWEQPVSYTWASLNEELRIALVSESVKKYLDERHLVGVQVYVIGVKSDCQVYIDVEGLPGEKEKRAFCRAFEKFLKLNTEARLEVYLPTALDKLKRDKREATLAKRDPIVTTQTKTTERALRI